MEYILKMSKPVRMTPIFGPAEMCLIGKLRNANQTPDGKAYIKRVDKKHNLYSST